jgi:hypothetical protein
MGSPPTGGTNMKRTRIAIATGILGCLLFGAGIADAGVVKFTFRNVTFPDGTAGTIRAGSKMTNKANFTQCGYYDSNDVLLGEFGSPDCGTTDGAALEDFCWSHFFERQ